MSRIGDSIARREDAALVTGNARYTDDFTTPNMAFAAIVRSRYGRAAIDDIDISRAEKHEDVLAVYTDDDVGESHSPGVMETTRSLPGSDNPDSPIDINRELTIPTRRILATDEVKYQGEPVAVVIADSRYAAHEATDLVEIDYRRLEGIVDLRDAIDDDGPPVHSDVADNVAFDWEIGDKAAVDAAFEQAPQTVSVEIDHQRLLPNAIEPRAVVADYDQSTEQLTVTTGTQVPYELRDAISKTLDVPVRKIRVISPAMGGGFGSRSKFYPAEMIVSWCAIDLERPVKWQATRSESYLSTTHGRGHRTRGELAFDDEGNVLGLRARSHADMGAYVSKAAPSIHTMPFAGTLSGQYDIPAISCHITGVFTTTTPVDSYRGTSRPQAILLLEQLIERAARKLGIDPVTLRRRNLVPPDAFPFETAVGVTYGSGDYERTIERALELVGYESLREQQQAQNDDGRRLGVGVGCFVDQAGDPRVESGSLEVRPSGTVVAYTGSDEHGQGHYTTLAQVVADEFGISYDDVEVEDGDTDQLPGGTGTFGSRTAVVGATALVDCAKKIRTKAKRIAAHDRGVTERDVEFDDGTFFVEGTPDRSLSLAEVARLANTPSSVPPGLEPGLEATTMSTTDSTFPHGTHVAVVEVDVHSGELEIIDYVAVDDCGTQINPMIVEGQIHGGVAQGIGQALYESAIYDDNGTLLTGSLQDYAVPKAMHLPRFRTGHTSTPSPTNPLGVKGAGESGTNVAPAAVTNAVLDALLPATIDRIELPMDEETIWRASEGSSS